jgi:hypothetical protein
MSKHSNLKSHPRLRLFKRNRFFGSQDIEVVNGGDFLNGAKVNLIFWGAFWIDSSSNPTHEMVTNDVKKILLSSFMREIREYGIDSKASFHKAVVVSNSEPRTEFRDHDVAQLIEGMIDNGDLPDPDTEDGPFLNCVIMPKDIVSEHSGESGFHFSSKPQGFRRKLQIAYILFGSRDFISNVFSHELIEACTNPNEKGIRIKSTQESIGNEIADICQDSFGKLRNGVSVQSYWSQKEKSCIIPK